MIYDITIQHPKGDAGTVTVRRDDDINGFGFDELTNGTEFTGTIEFKSNGDVWATIVDNKNDPSNNGFFCALVYAGKTFAKWVAQGEEEPLPVLDRYYVKEDWYTKRWGYKPRPVAPDPGIFPVSSTIENWPQTEYCQLPEKWQLYWANLMSVHKFGKLFNNLSRTDKYFIITAFKGVTGSDKAFNNYNGTDKYRNYVANENITKPDPKQESLICCGNFVYSNKPPVMNSKGVLMVELYSFHASDTPPQASIDMIYDPRVQIAKIVNPPKIANQLGYLTNFPQLKNGCPVPFPFLTRAATYYPLHELIKM